MIYMANYVLNIYIIRLPAFHVCLCFAVEFLASMIGFNTTCKDSDSINQHSHPSTTAGLERMAHHDLIYRLILFIHL